MQEKFFLKALQMRLISKSSASPATVVIHLRPLRCWTRTCTFSSVWTPLASPASSKASMGEWMEWEMREEYGVSTQRDKIVVTEYIGNVPNPGLKLRLEVMVGSLSSAAKERKGRALDLVGVSGGCHGAPFSSDTGQTCESVSQN